MGKYMNASIHVDYKSDEKIYLSLDIVNNVEYSYYVRNDVLLMSNLCLKYISISGPSNIQCLTPNRVGYQHIDRTLIRDNQQKEFKINLAQFCKFKNAEAGIYTVKYAKHFLVCKKYREECDVDNLEDIEGIASFNLPGKCLDNLD